jgi:FMN-dependent NADH-azoreductase
MKILHIDSSVTGAKSVSRPLTRKAIAKLQQLYPEAEVTYRNLIADPLRHYTAVLRIFGADAPNLTPDQQHELATGEAILAEFLAADIVLLGAPMYNFNIPSQLKAWIDLLAVAGKTFSYQSGAPQGLCGGKRILIVSSRGGMYGPGSPYETADFQERYLKHIFGFFGITDITVIRAEGIGHGPDAAKAAIASAEAQITELS